MGVRFFNYYGGKDSMLCHILPLIPKHDHYVEACFGSGAVFFAKPPSRIETINDSSKAVINFYRVTKSHAKALWRLIDETLYSESDFQHALQILKAPGKDKVTWAWAFWVAANMSFAGDIAAGFKLSIIDTSKAVRVFQGKKKAFVRLQGRLENAQILNRDIIRVIEQLDREGTFFYLDPPYPDCDQGHYHGYTLKDFTRLLDTLSSIQGKFLLSSYTYPVLDRYVQLFGWSRQSFEKTLTVNPSRNTKKTEILTYNYLPPMFQKSLF
jgi:DNA adenine methylase